MPAEEREPVPGASRRNLLAAALGVTAVAALVVRPTEAQGARAHDPHAWAALVTEFERRLARSDALAKPADEAERAKFRAEADAKARAASEPRPPEAKRWVEGRSYNLDGGQFTLAGRWVEPISRGEMLAEAMERPEQQFRLDAWDAWKARQAAHFEAPEVVTAQRRYRAHHLRYLRANDQLDNAIELLLKFPTLDPSAIRFKTSTADRFEWETGAGLILEACLAVLDTGATA